MKKVLIANRGEIALRINRACHELGLSTVAVYSTVDVDALHVKFADESVCIGPPAAKESYLNMQSLLAAAEVTDADAIHPGYGFLSENADFANLCTESGIKFIGPSSKVIHRMGHKVNAKEAAEKAGVPILPSLRLDQNVSMKLIKEKVEAMGFPILIKAAMGGGGRGMKLVRKMDELERMIEVAKNESLQAFGSNLVYIEKFALNPRHIEIQILADERGNVIHLGERDCSIQRRHQKLVEESPSAVITPEIRKKMGAAAVALAESVGYSSAGTIEYVTDQDLNFYFLEMNTRIQVEHPVTEMVTGVDLLKQQILVAQGEKLSITQKDIQVRGHAIECRITAEDPKTFLPAPGRIQLFHPPCGLGVRLESAACSDYVVSPYYDSMICKLIVHGDSRGNAILKMREALKEFVIHGIKTTIPFHRSLMTHPDFVAGRYDTGFIRKNFSN